MKLRRFLRLMTVIVAAIALASSTVSLCSAGTALAEGPLLTEQDVNGGHLIFTDPSPYTVSGNTVTFSDGYSLTVSGEGIGAIEPNAFDVGADRNGTHMLYVSNDASVTFTLGIPAGVKIPDGEKPRLQVRDGGYDFDASNSCTVSGFNFVEGSTLGDVSVDRPGSNPVPQPPSQTRDVTVRVDDASAPILTTGKIVFTVGYGDNNDVTFESNPSTLSVDAATRDKIILGFRINKKYFLPYAVVNGKTYETTDTGEHPDPDTTVLCVELAGEDADVDEFTINLSIYAVANVNYTSQSLLGASAGYQVAKDGVAGITSDDVELSIADAETDPAVEGAVATFDMGVDVDGRPASTTGAPLDMSLDLDTSVFTASDYTVVRNHEGTLTALDTTYDPATGRASFSSDQFSEYSLVAGEYRPATDAGANAGDSDGDGAAESANDGGQPAGAIVAAKPAPTSPAPTSRTATPKTADSSPAGVAAACLAAGAVLVAGGLRRRQRSATPDEDALR